MRAEMSPTIANGVANAILAVYNSGERLKKAREAVTACQAAVAGSGKDKLRLGTSSLRDLATLEGRLTDALAELVNAQQSYAIALAEHRLAGGTLIAPDREVQSVEREFFSSPEE